MAADHERRNPAEPGRKSAGGRFGIVMYVQDIRLESPGLAKQFTEHERKGPVAEGAPDDPQRIVLLRRVRRRSPGWKAGQRCDRKLPPVDPAEYRVDEVVPVDDAGEMEYPQHGFHDSTLHKRWRVGDWPA